ncbi:L-threonine 3-dehydrogenase [Roseovarius sp. A-2]|uniref:zinc-dependent alcohol dehydrogenase n=1 Tax=Roseovarius sp. A-2 TaxID=1570360 RepID=UPI0009B571E8|nr:alcohol dehydrogenase catalytic domain-containing protein [Roseovarius sp. A-2]GAW33525.1 L-threonine 3-dehydrogenase [Roseovarius sp. A-2]
MIAVRKLSARPGIDVCNVPDPQGRPGRGMLRVRVEAAGICGSDLHTYKWSSGYEFMEERLPITLGHEFSGTVHTVGSGVNDFADGHRVVCWPVIPCGKCEGCERGYPEQCRDRSIVGLHRDGGFAEWVDVPAESCLIVPNSLTPDIAALAEPLAVSVNSVDLSEAGPGDTVVVLGPGPIGLCAAWVAQHRGAQVLLAGLNDDARLKTAQDMGLEHVVDLARANLASETRQVFGRDADIVIEATGHPDSVSQGLRLLRPCGVFVAAGIHGRPYEIDLTRFVREKKQIRGAHDTTRAAFAEAVMLLSDHGGVLSQLITHQLPFSRGSEGFEIANGGAAVKVMLVPDHAEKEGSQ